MRQRLRCTAMPAAVGALLATVLLIPRVRFPLLLPQRLHCRPSTFGITIDFGGGLTTNEEAVFTEAANYWQSVITGYKPGLIGMGGVKIAASAAPIDGVGGVLANTSLTQTVSRPMATALGIPFPRVLR